MQQVRDGVLQMNASKRPGAGTYQSSVVGAEDNVATCIGAASGREVDIIGAQPLRLRMDCHVCKVDHRSVSDYHPRSMAHNQQVVELHVCCVLNQKRRPVSGPFDLGLGAEGKLTSASRATPP